MQVDVGEGYSGGMATNNGWATPVHETLYTTDAGNAMVRVVVRKKTGLMRIYIKHPDGTRLGLSVDSKHILAAKGMHQETIRKALDQAEKVTAETTAPVTP